MKTPFYSLYLVIMAAVFSLNSSGAFAAVEELSYQASSGVQLEYLVAAPSFEVGEKYPLLIFQPGDGNVVDTFQPEQYQAMMDAFAQNYGVALVMPQLRRQLYTTDLKKYCKLDFYERIGDLSKLIDTTKALSFVNPNKIILWGYSAGGDVATLTANRRRDLWGVVTYGTGVVSNSETGEKPQVTQEFLDNDCSNPANYINRSGKFWKQLFVQTKEFADIRLLSIPYLAMFGEIDPVTPFDNDQALYSGKLTKLKRDFSYEVFPGLDHTGYFNPSVVQRMMAWAQLN